MASNDARMINEAGCEWGRGKHERADKRVEDIFGLVSDMRVDIGRVLEHVDIITRTCTHCRASIDGNGSIGLRAQMAEVQSNLRRLWGAQTLLWVGFVGACSYFWDKLWSLKL